MNLVQLIAGVDEAGRGPLAGPVVASAVILHPQQRIDGLNDSKQLTAKVRTRLAAQIKMQALAWSVAMADNDEIDALNILQATHLAMRRALIGLHLIPTHVQIDGNRCPSLQGLGFNCSAETIVGGDALIPAISAASILAKVTRDAWMSDLSAQYPEYGFAAHKGYGTAAHLKALERYGPLHIHRRSFAPVRQVMQLCECAPTEPA